TTLDFVTTRYRWVHFRSSLGCAPAQVFFALFPQRSPPTAFDRSSLEVVYDLLLKADPEGPSFIDCTARPRLRLGHVTSLYVHFCSTRQAGSHPAGRATWQDSISATSSPTVVRTHQMLR